jgi:hypothetical protein
VKSQEKILSTGAAGGFAKLSAKISPVFTLITPAEKPPTQALRHFLHH